MPEPPIFQTPDAYCAACGKRLNATGPISDPDGQGPDPGSITVCVGCGAILIYRADMRLRFLTPAEMARLHADAEAWTTIERIQAERRSGAWRQRLPGTS